MMEVQAQHPVWKLWLNPILRRYCRSRLRPRAIGVVLLIDILIAGFLVAMAVSAGKRMDFNPEDVARGAVIPLLVFQSLILFAVGTAQVSGGMVAERDEGVIDYQRLAPMTPLAKTLGYLFGLPIREWLMFAGTLPFSLWAIIAGGVPLHVWVPLYGVLFSTAILYHLTGLVTGTVVRNRRTAFLFSIGLVFCLYTIIPQAAKFGLVFFDYLTIRPVFRESLVGITPNEVGSAIHFAQTLAPRAKFFNLDFGEAVFTLFTQAGLMLTFIVMLCRKWRSQERHLLGKVWATSLFAWIHILLLGNALPLIGPGLLFPSRGFNNLVQRFSWSPKPIEAVAMSGLYGLVTLILIFMLCSIITPGLDSQLKFRRQNHKHGLRDGLMVSDPASSWPYVLVMAVLGGIGWFIFTRGLFESRWFERELSVHAALCFVAVLLAGGLLFQTLLEGRGKRQMALWAVLIGVVPIMVGAVFATIGGGFTGNAAWVFALSPASMPVYAAIILAPTREAAAGNMEYAFHFWLAAGLLAAGLLSFKLRQHHRTLSRRAAGPPPMPAALSGDDQ